MKSIYILITLFIIALSTLAGACQRHKNTGVTSPDEQAEIKMLKQEIHDSIRTFNVNFAKEAILKGKMWQKTVTIIMTLSYMTSYSYSTCHNRIPCLIIWLRQWTIYPDNQLLPGEIRCA